MRLTCRKCRRTIEPEQAMVVVTVDQPARWALPDHVLARLAQAPGRWHYDCAPIPVRQYAAALLAGASGGDVGG
jgi:hypothetical protein